MDAINKKIEQSFDEIKSFTKAKIAANITGRKC